MIGSRILALTLISVTIAAMNAGTVVPVRAQSPTPAPLQTVRSGQTVTIAPGQTLVFLRPSIRVPGSDNSIRVVNQSEQAATAIDDGRIITLTAPEGFAIIARTEYETTSVQTVPCRTQRGSPNVALCAVEEQRANHFVRFTTTTMPAALEQVPLALGCNNVTLTSPDGTPTAEIAEDVSPEQALIAIWRLDAPSGRFLGWSPLAGAPNDLLASRRLDAVFICVREPAALARPAL